MKDLQTENGHHRLMAGEVTRANEQLRAEGIQLTQRIEILEEENRRLSDANEVMKRGIGEVSDCYPKMNEDMTDLKRELDELRDEIRATRPKAEPLAPPAADVTAQHATMTAARARK
jgi:chromosome segregation ATPase